MTARDVFLTIALAVARDGLPVPDAVSMSPAGPGTHGNPLPNRVRLDYKHQDRPVPDALAAAEHAAKILNLTDFYAHPDGIVYQWADMARAGWWWTVTAFTPTGTSYTPGTKPADPLGDALVAAVTDTARRGTPGGGTRG